MCKKKKTPRRLTFPSLYLFRTYTSLRWNKLELFCHSLVEEEWNRLKNHSGVKNCWTSLLHQTICWNPPLLGCRDCLQIAQDKKKKSVLYLCWFTVLCLPSPPTLSPSHLPHSHLSFFLFSCTGSFLFLVFGLVIRFIQEEVVAGDREGAHQDDELGEVHLPVVVGVQVVHHLLYSFIIFGVLSVGREGQRMWSLCVVFSFLLPVQGRFSDLFTSIVVIQRTKAWL